MSALLASVVVMHLVLRAPAEDVRDLVIFLAGSGGGSLLLGLVAMGTASSLGLDGLRGQLMLAHLLVLVVALANIVVTAWLMFISPHDLALLGILLAFSGVVALALAGSLADRVLGNIRRLGEAARRVAAGHLASRVDMQGIAELDALGRDFNEMAARLEESERSTRELEAARRHLVAAISHDLRTPLASIRAMVEAINDGVVADAETVGRYMRTIQGEAKYLGSLIDDLFELSRLEAGALTLHVEPDSLHDLISDAIEALNAQATAKGLRLRGRVDPGLPPVLMDAARMERVLYNLIQNAIRHTPSDGTVTLGAQEESDAVRVDVIDTGEGVPPDDLPHIFDQFYRGEKSRMRGQAGAGLGLAIAKGLVEAHGGRIWAQNLPEQGTRFSFVLPKAP